MAKLQQVLGAAFDADAVEPQQSFDLLPAGTYTVEITETDVNETKSGTGTLLKVVHRVIDPAEHAGRLLWNRINLRNQNQQAEQIGQAQLSALCRAAGIGVLEDSDDLIGAVVRAKVVIRPARDGYDAQNEVKGYESANASKPPVKAAAAPSKPAAKSPPWAKKAA